MKKLIAFFILISMAVIGGDIVLLTVSTNKLQYGTGPDPINTNKTTRAYAIEHGLCLYVVTNDVVAPSNIPLNKIISSTNLPFLLTQNKTVSIY